MSQEDRHEVFRGHFEECIKHLGGCLASKVPRGSKGAGKAKRPIADFCGVSIDTVTRWLGGQMPIGELIIKLMSYLDLIGYRVIEFERLQKSRRNFAELIGFGLLNMEQAAVLLGYANSSTLSQVLQGHNAPNEDKEQKMWEIWKERREELEIKKKQAQEQYHLDLTPATKLPMPPVPTPAAKVGAPAVSKSAITSIMEGLLVLLEGTSDEMLVDLGQPKLILRLSGRLSAISARLVSQNGRKEPDD